MTFHDWTCTPQARDFERIIMRLQFIVLLPIAATFAANSNALPSTVDSGKSIANQVDPVEPGRAQGKRFLRTLKTSDDHDKTEVRSLEDEASKDYGPFVVSSWNIGSAH
ncbi:hypothetical protein ON010_g8858 [Phytophthora cinnamomi]|nr:hypothetical protein ON010_g8858 [Phytophthora cinnamomi]